VSIAAGTLLHAGAVVLSGALLTAAFPPFGESEAAWMALVPLLLVARHCRPRRALRWGFAAGGVFWLAALSWLLTLSRTGGPWPLVMLGWILLAAYCALYTGAFAGLVAWMAARTRDWPPAAAQACFLVATPVLWVGLEFSRSVLFTGFPWNALGVSQYRNVAIVQLAAWGGVYAVSALLVFVNAALTLMALRVANAFRRRRQSRISVALAAGLVVWALCTAGGMRAVRRIDAQRGAATEVVVAALEPAVPQLKKWPPRFATMIQDRLRRGTELAAGPRTDLVVWPETAVPGAVGGDPRTAAFIRDMAGHGTPILAGAMEEAVVNGDTVLYNSSFLFLPDGRVADRYRKMHLVPFGEYLPFEDRVPWIKNLAPLGFSCRPGRRMTVFALPVASAPEPVAFSVLICFEDTMPDLARRAARAGARFFVNQTNDAWFDGSAGPEQHLSHCVFRCVENRLPAVRCANTGVTAFIDRAGRIDALRRENGGEPGFKLDRLFAPPAGASPTPYRRFGDLLLGIPCAAAVVALFVLVAVIEKREGSRKQRGS